MSFQGEDGETNTKMIIILATVVAGLVIICKSLHM